MDWGQDAFCFSTLDLADDNRDVFKYLADEQETRQPPILQGLLLMLVTRIKTVLRPAIGKRMSLPA